MKKLADAFAGGNTFAAVDLPDPELTLVRATRTAVGGKDEGIVIRAKQAGTVVEFRVKDIDWLILELASGKAWLERESDS